MAEQKARNTIKHKDSNKANITIIALSKKSNGLPQKKQDRSTTYSRRQDRNAASKDKADDTGNNKPEVSHTSGSATERLGATAPEVGHTSGSATERLRATAPEVRHTSGSAAERLTATLAVSTLNPNTRPKHKPFEAGLSQADRPTPATTIRPKTARGRKTNRPKIGQVSTPIRQQQQGRGSKPPKKVSAPTHYLKETVTELNSSIPRNRALNQSLRLGPPQDRNTFPVIQYSSSEPSSRHVTGVTYDKLLVNGSAIPDKSALKRNGKRNEKS